MENSGIVLRKAVLHVLDNGYMGLILSDHPLDLVGEQFVLSKFVWYVFKGGIL